MKLFKVNSDRSSTLYLNPSLIEAISDVSESESSVTWSFKIGMISGAIYYISCNSERKARESLDEITKLWGEI